MLNEVANANVNRYEHYNRIFVVNINSCFNNYLSLFTEPLTGLTDSVVNSGYGRSLEFEI